MEQFTNQWDTFTKSALASGKALESLNLKFFEDLGKQQSALLTSTLELTQKWFSNLGDVKAFPELVSAQSKLASEFGAKWLDAARETSALLNASKDEYKAWFEKGFQTFGATPDAVAKPARKAA